MDRSSRPSFVRRRLIGGLVLGTLALAGAIGGVVLRTRAVLRPMSPEVARELADGTRFADSLLRELATAPATAIGTAQVVAAGYLERQRLGLGSPFRLIDYAARDPLLTPTIRRRLGYAILGRTLAGAGYEVDETALDLIAPGDRISARVAGARHRAVIDSVIAEERDPRIGELAVRIGYRLAAAAGRVGRRGSVIATQTAALARDRALAREDVRRLLIAAKREEIDPLVLLPTWREARRFAVERPLVAPLAPGAEREAIGAARRLAAMLDTLGQEEPHGVGAADAPTRVLARTPLGDGAARRLAGVALARGAPPNAPVTVAVNGYRSLLDARRLDPATRAAAEWLGAHARNEETLAAAYGLIAARDSSGTAAPGLMVLWTAVSLHAFGQEPVWFPGDGGPSAAELADRFALASLTFDDDIPTTWRPYYLRMLASAVGDVQRVLPALSLRGLAVHFGDSPMRGTALAMHDPATRRVYLPVTTAAGTIAHELAHDLDWQDARLRFGAAARSYSTDRATRENRGRLATSVLELASVGLAEEAHLDSASAAVSRRPTEIFARNVDWFVTASLARLGRVNGYLSAVQDAQLTGYAAVTTPEVSRQAGDAMVRALDEMTIVPAETREWFLDTYGRRAGRPSYEVVRRVLEVPLPGAEWRQRHAESPLGVFAVAGEEPPRSSGALVAGACFAPAGDDARLASARVGLAVAVAEARARGVLRRRALLGAQSPTASWRVRALAGAPWRPEYAAAALHQLRDAILQQADAAASTRGVSAIAALALPRGC